MIQRIMDFLNSNSGGITVMIALIAAVYKFRQFVDIKKSEQKQRNFDNYHRLIKELSQPDGSGATWLDRQVAVVYELRNFPQSKKASIRILGAWLAKNKTEAEKQKYKVLYDEMNLTLEYFKKNHLIRKFSE